MSLKLGLTSAGAPWVVGANVIALPWLPLVGVWGLLGWPGFLIGTAVLIFLYGLAIESVKWLVARMFPFQTSPTHGHEHGRCSCPPSPQGHNDNQVQRANCMRAMMTACLAASPEAG